MRLLRFLFFRRRRRREATPIREQEAYVHSYGDRSGEVFGVVRMPEQPQTEPEREPEPEEQEPIRSLSDGLTGELLRRAFEARLDARGRAAT